VTSAGAVVAAPAATGLAYFGDVAGLRALGAVNDLEFDRLAFFERAESVALDGREVYEHVTPALALDEAIPFGVVEPLDLTCDTHLSCPALQLRGVVRRLTQNLADGRCRSRGIKKDREPSRSRGTALARPTPLSMVPERLQIVKDTTACARS
jgi:hypothetical protein